MISIRAACAATEEREVCALCKEFEEFEWRSLKVRKKRQTLDGRRKSQRSVDTKKVEGYARGRCLVEKNA